VLGDENVVATLSRIEKLQSPMDYFALVALYKTDEELQKHEQRESGLQLQKIDVPGVAVAVFCDLMGTSKLFLTRPFRRFATASTLWLTQELK